MQKWLRRLRGGVGMGLTWAVEWLVGGLMIGVASKLLPGLSWDWFFGVFDAPLPALAIPGFFAGIFFSIVLGIAGRRHRFRDLSLPVFAAWGAFGGLLLAGFPLALSAVGLATLNGNWFRLLIALGAPSIVFGAASATVSLLLARWSAGQELESGAFDATFSRPAEHAPDRFSSHSAPENTRPPDRRQPVPDTPRPTRADQPR